MDELCVCKTPALWVWIVVSRSTRQVLGFVFGDRTDAPLEEVWLQVPPAYRAQPVCTDAWGGYGRLLPPTQHRVVEKGSGQTSIVEGLHTKWRQRQSGLVRRCCGVHPNREDDIRERLQLLIDTHNRKYKERWLKLPQNTVSTLSSP